MTQALFLATKTPSEGESTINGVRAVLVNLVSTSTNLQVQTEAASVANVAYHCSEYVPAYFDAVVQIGDLSGGPLNANKKGYVLDPNAGLLAATGA